MSEPRRSYEESIVRLQQTGVLRSDETPPLPAGMPQPENSARSGLSFYRMRFEKPVDLSNLIIPRTFFGRSEIKDFSFENTDLSESNLRWNDFIDVDFDSASLANSDLRASIFVRVNFANSDLSGADLRRADYEDCSFSGAKMTAAKLTRPQAEEIKLSDEQVAEVDWQDTDGPEPSGG